MAKTKHVEKRRRLRVERKTPKVESEARMIERVLEAAIVVLLDPRVLVVHMQRRDDPVGNDAGAIPRGGASADAPVEDQLHVVGSSHVEVLAHHLLEEDPSGQRSVEDLGAARIRLAGSRCRSGCPARGRWPKTDGAAGPATWLR